MRGARRRALDARLGDDDVGGREPRADAATTSPRAAASAPVTTPTARGNRGSGRLRSAANSPSAASTRFSRSIAARWSPSPIRSIVLARKLSSPFAS